jgi:hypothetical protein
MNNNSQKQDYLSPLSAAKSIESFGLDLSNWFIYYRAMIFTEEMMFNGFF